MKYYIGLFMGLWSIFLTPLYANDKNERDSLLYELDKVVSNRQQYSDLKQRAIDSLKQVRLQQTSPEEVFRLNIELIDAYATFVCDSAEYYIHDNLRIAKLLNNPKYFLDSQLQLAFIYSLSGLFVQANEIFKSIQCKDLPNDLKAMYCWKRIRYYENLIRYTDDIFFSKHYTAKTEAYRDTLMSVLGEGTDLYRKELAFKLQYEGKMQEALDLLNEFYEKEEPGTHGWAMLAMGLAKVYEQLGDSLAEEKYLILAATADKKLAIKENEALLSLVGVLYQKGDIDRAYNYVKVVLDDASFYNSRFKHTVIARIHPIIWNTYLIMLEEQKRNLQISLLIIVGFIVVLTVLLCFTNKQMRAVSRARSELKRMNNELSALNEKLNEVNAVKEQYISYFMNQCAVYINKLDEYRRDVLRKLKAGKSKEVCKASAKPFERELEDLYTNFDKAFLQLYPHFMEDFNALLRPEGRYTLPTGKLNVELRIFALMRLGITNMGQVASFLHCSTQTVYNYKSKVKSLSDLDRDSFDERVRKLGNLSVSAVKDASNDSTF